MFVNIFLRVLSTAKSEAQYTADWGQQVKCIRKIHK